jgi:hypothetical protein
MPDRHKTKPKAVRMPGGLLAWYEAEAKRTGQTVNGLLVAALEENRRRAEGGATTPPATRPRSGSTTKAKGATVKGSGSTTRKSATGKPQAPSTAVQAPRRCTHPGKRVIGGYCPQCDAVVQPGGDIR